MRRLQVTLFVVLFFLLATAGPAPAQEKSHNPSPGRAGGSSDSGGQRLPDSRYLGRLLLGDDAPDFELPADDGTRFHLHSIHGLESVAVLFVQRPDRDLSKYAHVGDSLRQNGVRVLFVCAERAAGVPAPWPNLWVLYDHRGEVAQRFGAFDLVTGTTVPALFLLDDRGRVRFLAVGYMPGPADLSDLATRVLVEEENMDPRAQRVEY
jgi:alkyl hydroperoxide reductase subunit AhpC